LSEGKEVAVIGPQRSALLRPVAPVGEILAAQNEARQVIQQALVNGRDYGVVPGTGGKATLFKPGAERVNAAFGAAATFKIVEREVDHDRAVQYTKRGREGASVGLYRYVVNCTLVQRETGLPLGEGIGVCSTMESKYVDRPRDLENTVLKMAEKRALIAATLVAYGLSDQFTQDAEDSPVAPETDAETVDATAEPEPAASPKQLGFLAKLMASSVFSEREREAVKTEVDADLTRDRASILIEEALAKIDKREKKAKPREPGEDDDA